MLSVAVVRSSLMAMQYVMYFRFCGWRHVFTVERMGQWKTTCFVQFAKWRHRWRSLPFWAGQSRPWQPQLILATSNVFDVLSSPNSHSCVSWPY